MHNDPVNCVDLWGLEANDSQNSTQRSSHFKGPDINLFPDTENIYTYVQEIWNPDFDNTFVISGHGNASAIYDKNGRVEPEDLAEMIKNNDNYKEGMTIKLLSCSTGKTENGFAQQLADEMGEGTKVVAPSDTLWISDNGSLEIYGEKKKEKKDDDEKSEKTTEKIPGEWKTFIGRKK